MRRLPIGIQDFVKLRDASHVYVDKTEIIYKLVNGPQGAYFLSRPRRFGKSLLCSTLKAIFEGRRDLFQEIGGYPALAIDKMDWEWKKHPVILIQFNVCNFNEGVEQLRTILSNTLENTAAYYGLKIRGENLNVIFSNLIIDLYNELNERVVVIIDEYDKPLLDTIDNEEMHVSLRGELKGFYGVLKSFDSYLRFSFITGVTKFSKVSLFSDLNQLNDLSLDSKYAEICGLTHEEIIQNFEPEIQAILEGKNLCREEYLDDLREYYNGYRFTKRNTTVYNPFGMLLHFDKDGDYLPYWYESGSPSFLVKLIKEQKINILDIDNMVVYEECFQKYDIENMAADVVLYQAGYLTIVDFDEESKEYKLDYPNLEVRSSFAKSLARDYFETSFDTVRSLYSKLPKSFLRGDVEGIVSALQYFLAGVPYDIIKSTENYYQTFVHLAFTMLGLNCRSEVRIATGRMDTMVETKNFVYCFEFKINESAEKALEQIDSKDYLLHWKGSGKKLFKIGINFDTEKRNIGDWKHKEH